MAEEKGISEVKGYNVKLTLGELNHILALITDNRRSQTHYGNRKQWLAQQSNIINKFALVEIKSLEEKAQKKGRKE
jgi:hypothetical protein